MYHYILSVNYCNFACYNICNDRMQNKFRKNKNYEIKNKI